MMSSTQVFNLGLTGYPLDHSLSPRIHQAALRATGTGGEYRLYPIPPTPGGEQALAELLGRIKTGELHGLNVTIPHKRRVFMYMDMLTPTARATGAVNTVYLDGDRLAGDNTDVQGFLHDLHSHLPPGMSTGQALVLGAGGSARAVAYALLLEGWQVAIAARRAAQAVRLVEDLTSTNRVQSGRILDTLELNFDSLADEKGLATATLIVNCTPLGMAPDSQTSPWPEELPLPQGAFVYDLVYNPAETSLMQKARRQGLQAANGLGMLVEQAALAFERWTGKPALRGAMLASVQTGSDPHG